MNKKMTSVSIQTIFSPISEIDNCKELNDASEKYEIFEPEQGHNDNDQI